MTTLFCTDKTPFIVDDEDVERLKKYKWTNGGTTIYRNTGRPNRLYAKNWQTIQISLANEIMQTRGIQYDHKDIDYTNNQKNNLRKASDSQNSANHIKSSSINYTSKYKGVCWHKRRNKWQAAIRVNRQLQFLGYYVNELDAAVAYNDAAIECFGEFAVLNKF